MEPRRSARNKNKKQKTEESANKENADVICKTKAAKPATKKRLTGRLAGFVNMPLDILFEVRLVVVAAESRRFTPVSDIH